MRFFKKKQSKDTTGMPEMNTVTLSTILPSYSVYPLAYTHSRKFLLDGYEPLEHERERIKNRTVDWLLKDMRDAAFEADSRDEISYGKMQFTNQTYCINAIIAQNAGELKLALEQEKMILEEIDNYKKLETQLNERGGY